MPQPNPRTSLLRRQLLWHPKWQTFEKSPSKKSNTVANGELMLFWPSSNIIKGIGSGERRIKGDYYSAKTTLIRRSRQYCSFLMGIFQKFAIWDATRVACGGGYPRTGILWERDCIHNSKMTSRVNMKKIWTRLRHITMTTRIILTR